MPKRQRHEPAVDLTVRSSVLLFFLLVLACLVLSCLSCFTLSSWWYLLSFLVVFFGLVCLIFSFKSYIVLSLSSCLFLSCLGEFCVLGELIECPRLFFFSLSISFICLVFLILLFSCCLLSLCPRS
jgi:hypothetical protein